MQEYWGKHPSLTTKLAPKPTGKNFFLLDSSRQSFDNFSAGLYSLRARLLMKCSEEYMFYKADFLRIFLASHDIWKGLKIKSVPLGYQQPMRGSKVCHCGVN